MEFKVGQAVLFNGKGFFSSCIRFYNRINYHRKGWSHAGIITEVKDDHVLIHEALAEGFVCNYYEKYWLEAKIKAGEIKLKNSRYKLKDVKKHADSYLGRPYGYLDIAAIGLSMIFGFKFLKLTGARQVICSEAVSRVYYNSTNKRMNIAKEFEKSFDLITPTEVEMSNSFY